MIGQKNWLDTKKPWCGRIAVIMMWIDNIITTSNMFAWICDSYFEVKIYQLFNLHQ